MADLIFTNARLLSQEPGRPPAQALAVVAGRIVSVGSTDDVLRLSTARTRRVDLGGRTVVPGFNDAHVHVWKMGDMLTRTVDLRSVRSIAELVESLRTFVGGREGDGWVLGRGYNEARIAEGRRPTREDLDRALPGRAVYLTRTCGHIGVASSEALRRARVTDQSESPAGGALVRDERGQLTGELHETAMGLVTGAVGEPSDAEYRSMVKAAARHQLALGITSATDAGVTPQLLDVYRAMDRDGDLPYRVNAMALRRPVAGTHTFDLPRRTTTDMLRIDSIKLLADGGLSGATAALREPYRHCAEHGLLRLDSAEMIELLAPAHLAGLRIGVHAIGDAAIDQVLDVFEALAARGPGPGHRIEHFGLPDESQLARAVAVGVHSVPQAIFLRELGANFRNYLNDGLLNRAYPLRSMERAGLVVALSSDAPVVADDNPLTGIEAAVTRCDDQGVAIAPEESITVHQALRAYTVGGARASGDEANRGRLAPGLWADLAVLSEDPTSVRPEELGRVKVDATWLGGRLVHER